jgi:peptidoglycan/LPS O-acetylase OafA/YrhL
MHRILAIDGLRAFAVLAVLFFHLNEHYLPGGYVGVDIFFVISGFVVTASLSERRFTTIKELLLYFYARRLVRIMPALIVCLIAVSAFYAIVIPQSWLSSNIQKIGVAAFFGLSNIALAANSDTYFTPVGDFNPFLHTWSLGVEEQFYLIFPFVYFAYQAARFDLRKTTLPIAIFLVLSTASFVTSGVLSTVSWQWSFYTLPSRFWELGIGVLLFVTMDRWKPVLAERIPHLGLVGLVIIAASLAVPSNPLFPFPLAVFPAIGTAAIIAFLCARPDAGLTRFFASTACVGIGQRSYSLYLWHWPVFVFFRWTVGLDGAIAQVVAVVLVAVLGSLSYAFVEQPIRTASLLRRVPNGRVVTAGLVVVCAAAILGGLAMKASARVSISATGDRDVWYADAKHHLDKRGLGCGVAEASGVTPGGGTTLTWSPTGCTPSNGKLYVIGDSHATAYTPMLRQYVVESGREVVLYFKSLCGFMNLDAPMAAPGYCSDYQRAALSDFKKKLSKDDVLFLPGLRIQQFSPNQWGETVPERVADPIRDQAAVDEAKTIVHELTVGGAHLVFEAPKPLFPAPPYRCADWYSKVNPICGLGLQVSRDELRARRAMVMERLADLASINDRVAVWDPFPLLCPSTACTAFDGEKPLFFDGHHLSGYGNDVLSASFNRMMTSTFGSGIARTSSSR